METERCRVDGCQRPVGVRVQGLWLAHYARWRRKGTVDKAKPIQTYTTRERYYREESTS